VRPTQGAHKAIVPVKKTASGVDNTNRKTWHKDDFAAAAKAREAEEDKTADLAAHELKAIKRRSAHPHTPVQRCSVRAHRVLTLAARAGRDPLHQGLIVKRDHLQGRDYQLDLAARLNKTQVISNSTPLNQQAGYYCNVCDCILRDSSSYLDHINGKYHNRHAFFCCQPRGAGSSPPRLVWIPNPSPHSLRNLGMNMRVERVGLDSVKQRLEELKRKKEEESREEYVPDGFEKRVAAADADEERRKEEKRARKLAKREAERKAGANADLLDETQEPTPELAAMLGFTGFGSSKR